MGYQQKQGSKSSLESATAPYNFVPLPEQVLWYNEELPTHNQYRADCTSGYFDIILTTETPLYIRGPLTAEEAEEENKKKLKKQKEEKDKDKENKEITGNPPDFFYTHDRNVPVIPGSSLRGMLRSVFEIITYSKIQPVDAATTLFFRAVAARRQDKLGRQYTEYIGSFGSNIRAGYLTKHGDTWYIQPAQRFGPSEYFAKVRDSHKEVGQVKGIHHLTEREYKLAHFPVSYQSKPGDRRTIIEQVWTPAPDEGMTATLVCTGNMSETDSQTRSPRKNFVLVKNPDPKARALRISNRAAQDYVAGLSTFVADQLGPNGILSEGKPVFYLEPENNQGEVIYFGHNPYFRIAITHENDAGEAYTITPVDVLPAEHRSSRLDYAEAVFGFVRDGQRPEALAGRISVTEAVCISDTSRPDELFEEVMIPKILGSPKPTAFMHYLNQPDNVDLSSYNTYRSSNVKIRGHKLYWRKQLQNINDITATPKETEGKHSQHTKIRPIKSGVRFQFRVHFHNLTRFELGALAWAISLGGDQHLRHMLGMGKPHGLGVIKLDVELTEIQREARYSSLFADSAWQTGAVNTDLSNLLQDFETQMSEWLRSSFTNHLRMREFKTLLTFWQNNEALSYMPLEKFKQRPVLPSAGQVARKLRPT